MLPTVTKNAKNGIMCKKRIVFTRAKNHKILIFNQLLVLAHGWIYE